MRRLVLFDVDCTLIDAHGAGGRAVIQALDDVYGLHGDLDGYSFHGRTDPAIIRDLARLWSAAGSEAAGEGGVDGNRPEAAAVAGRSGYTSGEIERLLPACIERYVELLRHEVARGRVEVLPGVAELVPALVADPLVAVGLLTGNVEDGARIKLGPTGLWPLFSVGAFGSDSAHRPDLPLVAVARAERMLGRRFRGKEIVVVGDTPADIQCGEQLGVTAVAVATGRHDREQLASFGPDHLFDDFSDWRLAYEVLAGRRG